ncbi:hypothetical protein [Hamadaea tsunoensis]|uniref:hypothetical protein n=1 Tax=Hamadaea tsunoensis TaxID=53368 RepID=UPI0004885BE8|nr:hypothetical protein [Hamadaea tsunoensis]
MGRKWTIVAVWLLRAAAVLYVVDIVAVLAGAAEFPGRLRQVLLDAGLTVDIVNASGRFASNLPYTAAVIGAIAAAALLVSARLLAGDGSGGRIVALCVSGGLLLLGLYAALIGRPPVPSQLIGFSAIASGREPFVRALSDIYPGGYRILGNACGMLAMICLIVAVVLITGDLRTPAPAPETGRPGGH